MTLHRHGRVATVALAYCLALSMLLSSTVHAQNPTPSPSATPSATPWLAPTGLDLTQSVQATNPDGSFIPPEKREATSSLTWSAVPGFAGTYVLERSRAPYGSTEPRQWEAFANVTGTWFVEEPYPFLDLLAYQRCYRVATVVDGQTGAYSNEVCTVVPPSSGPEPAGEPPFNFDEVKEIVVPLIGDDGRTHHVTLSEDTVGIVRIRLSLFNFQPGTYHTVLFRRGSCSSTPTSGPGNVLTRDDRFTLEEDAATSLVLTFFNTDDITLTPGPKSIYGPDATFLVVFRPGVDGTELRAACAALSASPGPPDTGTGATQADTAEDYRAVVAMAAGIALIGAAALMALRRRV
jgi:hypothetical protein